MINDNTLPNNDAIIVHDYFVSALMQIQQGSSVILAGQTPQQQQFVPFSTILRLTNPIRYEEFSALNEFLIKTFKEENLSNPVLQNVVGITIQSLSPLHSFQIERAKIYTEEELQNRSYITPDATIKLKDDTNDKKDSQLN